jgi:hypothetical protein
MCEIRSGEWHVAGMPEAEYGARRQRLAAVCRIAWAEGFRGVRAARMDARLVL